MGASPARIPTGFRCILANASTRFSVGSRRGRGSAESDRWTGKARWAERARLRRLEPGAHRQPQRLASRSAYPRGRRACRPPPEGGTNRRIWGRNPSLVLQPARAANLSAGFSHAIARKGHRASLFQRPANSNDYRVPWEWLCLRQMLAPDIHVIVFGLRALAVVGARLAGAPTSAPLERGRDVLRSRFARHTPSLGASYAPAEQDQHVTGT
jgi:hypothetical protein